MRPVPAAGNRLARAIRFARVLPLLTAAFGSGSRPLIPRPAAISAAGEPTQRIHHETDQIRKPGFAVYTVERDGDKAQ